MRIIVHAGMHKTATSSFQATLQSHSSALAKIGVGFLKHWNAVENRLPDAARRPVSFSALKKMEAAGMHTVILTSESYSTLNQEQFGKFADSLAGHALSLVVVFRHWSTFLPSRWQQNCKVRDDIPFGDYIQRMNRTADRNFNMRYDLVLENLNVARFESVKVISYENALAGEGVLSNILQACDLPTSLFHARSKEYRNVALSMLETDILRLLNGVYARAQGQPGSDVENAYIEYRPRDVVFKLFKCLTEVKTRLGSQYDVLEKMVRDSQETTVLTRTQFSRLERIVEERAGPYLFNRIGGAFFGDVLDNTIAASSMTSQALPLDLQQDILETLRAVKGEGDFR